MSDDLPPPDLTKTADVPLDGLLPFNTDQAGEVPADPGEDTETPLFAADPPTEGRDNLFSEAKSLRLSSSEFVVDNPILEHEPRPAAGPLPQPEAQAEPLGALRAMWEESHDRGVPFYRRQGPLAGLGLFALLIIGAVSFPWTRATIESGVVILIDDSDESAAVGSGSPNREEYVDSPASGTMVMGAKSTTAEGSAEAFQSTSSQIASTSGVTAATPAAPTQAGPAATNEQSGPVSAETPETTAIVAPVQLSCEDPAAVPPACTTTEPPATTIPETPPVTEAPGTPTTEPEPETTVKRTTTTEPPETDEKPTTTKPKLTTTSTEPDDDGTTTTEPDDDDDSTTTTEPDDDDDGTTTTTEPDDDDDGTTTTTTQPDDDTIPDTTEPPIDSGGSLPTAVNCTPTTQTGPSVDVPPSNIC